MSTVDRDLSRFIEAKPTDGNELHLFTISLPFHRIHQQYSRPRPHQEPVLTLKSVASLYATCTFSSAHDQDVLAWHVSLVPTCTSVLHPVARTYHRFTRCFWCSSSRHRGDGETEPSRPLCRCIMHVDALPGAQRTCTCPCLRRDCLPQVPSRCGVPDGYGKHGVVPRQDTRHHARLCTTSALTPSQRPNTPNRYPKIPPR